MQQSIIYNVSLNSEISNTGFFLFLRLKEMQKQLTEERELSKALQNNQSSWHIKYKNLEQQYNEFKHNHDKEVTDLQEQLRDVMFFLDTQQKMANTELSGASITGVSDKEPETSSRRGNRRKKKE